MVYYKLIVDDKRLKSDGLYPIVLRITYNRSNTTVTTGIRIRKEQWDANSQLINRAHSNFQILNKSISEFYPRVQNIILKLIEKNEFSFETLKDQLSGKVKITLNFSDFAQKLIHEIVETKKTGNAIVYQTAVNRLLDFCGNRSIKLSEINYILLEAFKHQLTLEGLQHNSISNYFRSIRAIYNKAIKAKIIERSLYPFYDIKVKQQKTAKRAVSIEAIKNIMGVDLELGSAKWHSRNYFMLSFCLIGISFTDLAYLKPENIIKGRVIFKRRKTHKQYDIKITPEALSIFRSYKGINSKYLLPVLPPDILEDILEAKKLISQWIKTTNKYLKRMGLDLGLESPLTTYVARHTWATTAKKLGYSNEMIAEALGHEYGNRITSIYLDSFDQEIIDSLNEAVINTCFSSKTLF